MEPKDPGECENEAGAVFTAYEYYQVVLRTTSSVALDLDT